ncbi:MAG: ATP-binding protein [Bacteroidia bacterium]
MRDTLLAYWDYISYSGVKQEDKLEEIRRIVFLNRLGIVVGIIPLIGLMVSGNDMTQSEFLMEISTAAFLYSIPVLNRLLPVSFVRSLVFIGGVINVVLMTYQTGIQGGDILFFFPGIVAGAIIFDFKRTAELATFIIVTIVGTLTVVAFLKLGIINWTMSPELMSGDRFAFGLITGLFFSIFIVLYYFKINEEHQKLLLKGTKEQLALNQALMKKNDELQEQQKAMSEAKAQAEQANLVKSRFLSSISHELRTPLNAVVGFSDLLAESEMTAIQLEQVQLIRKAAGNLTLLINDILDYAKIEAGRLTINPHHMSIKSLLTEVVDVLGIDAHEKGLDLGMHIPSNTPDWVVADSTRLKQILYNLVSNAVKFTHAGNVRVDVESKFADEGTRDVTFSVKDSGLGISERDLSYVFDPFFQSDSSSTRKYQGAGLGLSICANLVGMMGSKLQVESTAGIGSTFSFTLRLPLVPTGFPTQKRTLPEAKKTIPTSLRVLLVEDNPINRRVTSFLFKKLGIEIDLAEDGAQGVEAAKAKPYDLILMDIHMPVMDGVEATQSIRKNITNGEDIKIVGLTANAIQEDLDGYQRSGMDTVLVKPLKLEVLRSNLQTWFGSYR